MAEQVRYLRQVVPHLEAKYGSEKAKAVMEKAQKRYAKLLEENSDEPKAYYMHIRERIYSSIAVFDALLEEDVSRKESGKFRDGLLPLAVPRNSFQNQSGFQNLRPVPHRPEGLLQNDRKKLRSAGRICGGGIVSVRDGNALTMTNVFSTDVPKS